MSRGELDLVVDWAADEGWNPGLRDAGSFYLVDPEGFFVGELDGEIISSVSAVRYEGGFGFLGFYIVKKTYRKQGYGLQIWNRAMSYLQGYNVGLDGVVDQQPNYRKSGFKLAHNNIRYCFSGRTHMSDKVMPLKAIYFNEILKLDRQCFPGLRENFLRSWISREGTFSFGIQEQGHLLAMGVIRPCRKGFKIGPLYADCFDHAEKIFRSLASYADGQHVYLDVPEVNHEAMKLAEKYQMEQVFETARMYTGDKPQMAENKIFGVSTFELG